MTGEQADKLRDLKRRVRDAYIGRGGIHAVGLGGDDSAICLYVDSEQAAAALCEKIRREIAPVPLIVIESDRAEWPGRR